MLLRLTSISIAALAGVCAAGVFVASVAAEDLTTDIGTLDKETADKAFPTKPPYSPYAGRNFPTRPYFGDTHTHTSYSMDAGAFGARLGPKDAYRFAKGEEVIASSGQRAKLSRPLDFMVVADHSDGMGFFPQLIGGDPGLLATPQGRKWYDEINSGKGAQAAIDIITSFGKGQMPKGFPTPGTPAYRSAWRETIKAAEEANDPAVSRPSSAMSGPRTPAATTFIAISFGATTVPRRAWSNLSPRCRRSVAQILAISGNGWRWLRKKPVLKFLRWRTTAT